MTEHDEGDEYEEGLGSFFKDGIGFENIDALYPIRSAQKKIQSLASLFRGGDAALVRIYILQEITSPQAKTEWRASDLRNYFTYIDSIKLETIIRSFANHGLLTWDSERLLYSVAPFARWIESVQKIASLIPIPAYIAADPDPAGIKIVRHIAQIWESISVHWEPWGMDGESLRALSNRKPLNDYDRRCIDSTSQEDRIVFKSLIEAMIELKEKGEQEGIVF